jgi:hypothetical protein
LSSRVKIKINNEKGGGQIDVLRQEKGGVQRSGGEP